MMYLYEIFHQLDIANMKDMYIIKSHNNNWLFKYKNIQIVESYQELGVSVIQDNDHAIKRKTV